MITRQKAKELVYERINAPSADWPDKPEMVVVEIEERDVGWVVYWTSRPYHETRDIADALAGNAPYLVCRETGSLFETGTVSPLEQQISDAEARLLAQLRDGRKHSYISVRWVHENLNDPTILVSELNSSRMELRKIEYYKDGRVGTASLNHSSGGTMLGIEPIPELREINADPQFIGEEISELEFNSQWEGHV